MRPEIEEMVVQAICDYAVQHGNMNIAEFAQALMKAVKDATQDSPTH